RLERPLWVHCPGGPLAGKRVREATEMIDVSRTALASLGLAFAKGGADAIEGRDLLRLTDDRDLGGGPPLVASLDNRYAVRWGDLVLTGKFPNAPRLCDLAVDVTCSFDRREVMPLPTIAIFRL